MKRDLTSLYGQLTVEERFRLVVEALAREDERETERLTSTCPRKVYEMNDLGFCDRLRASKLISLYVYIDLTEMVGVLRTIEMYRVAVEAYQEALLSSLEWTAKEAALSYHQGWDAGCNHAWQASGKHGPFPWNDTASLNERAKEMAKMIRAKTSSKTSDGSRQDTLEKASEVLSVRVRTIWEAFSRFCHEQAGLNPETALRACFPSALELPRELEEVAGSTQADSALSEDYEAMLVRIWGELVGKSN
jgi:hypothetical protein